MFHLLKFMLKHDEHITCTSVLSINPYEIDHGLKKELDSTWGIILIKEFN